MVKTMHCKQQAKKRAKTGTQEQGWELNHALFIGEPSRGNEPQSTKKDAASALTSSPAQIQEVYFLTANLHCGKSD